MEVSISTIDYSVTQLVQRNTLFIQNFVFNTSVATPKRVRITTKMWIGNTTSFVRTIVAIFTSIALLAFVVATFEITARPETRQTVTLYFYIKRIIKRPKFIIKCIGHVY